MNPYAILALIALLTVSTVGGFAYGHKVGVNEQKASDQGQFDAINKQTTDQKTEANAKYRAAQDANLALMIERDKLKTNLGNEHEKNRAATDALRTQYTGIGLRFTAETPRLGNSSGCTQGAGSDPASTPTATVIQLPDAITDNLQQLAFDADQLADNYRLCYGWAEKVK